VEVRRRCEELGGRCGVSRVLGVGLPKEGESVGVRVRRLVDAFVCEGVCVEGVKEVLRSKVGGGVSDVVGWFGKVVGTDLAHRALSLSSSKNVGELSCKLPYSRSKSFGSCLVDKDGEGGGLTWKPLGKVGRIAISDEVFERCCVEKSEVLDDSGSSLVEELESYGFSEELLKMFEWYVECGFGHPTSVAPNTGAYVKVKPDKLKLQIISDHSAANARDLWKPRSFRICSELVM
jgi:hypothetical protein